MPNWIALVMLLETFALPIVGGMAVLASKLTVGATAQAARHWFIGALVAVTVITCRTVINSDPHWLVHTTTLSMMFVGGLLLPDRQTLCERRFAAVSRPLA